MADAGFRLTIEGERDFKSALAAIDQQIRTNKAELKLLSEQYALSDDSMSGLVEKQKKLGEAYEAQAEKVRLLEEQYDHASATYGENDKAVLKLKDSLLAAQTALASMSNEQEKNQRAIDAAWESMERQKSALAAYDETVRELGGAFAETDAVMEKNSERLAELAEQYDSLGDRSGDLRKKQENLKQQNELLNTGIETQKKKIDALNTGLKEAEKLFGGNSDEVADYKKKIDAATSELEEMERQIGENNEALKSTADDGGNALADILGKVTDMTGLQIPDGIKNMIGGIDGATAAFGGWTAAIGAAAGLVKETQQALIETADKYKSLYSDAQTLGIDTTEYQKLQYALTMVGVESSELGGFIDALNGKIKEAHDVIGDYAGNMENLRYATDEERKAVTDAMNQWSEYGVALYDQNGELRDTIDIFYELIAAYEQYGNKTERITKMQGIFGESASKLNPLVDAGADNLRKFAENAEKAGVVLDEVAVNRLYELSTAAEITAKKTEVLSDKWKLFWHDLTDIGNWGSGNLSQSASGLWDSITGLFQKGYATGTYNHPGGYAVVGERGPEIVDLPRGSKVYPNGEIPDGMGGGPNVWNISINASSVREFNDIVKMAQSARQSLRMG